MSNRYLIWRENETREDARKMPGDDAGSAVERWATWTDSWEAEYLIAHGQSERVWAALNEEGSEAKLFEVSGEAIPQYHAEEVVK